MCWLECNRMCYTTRMLNYMKFSAGIPLMRYDIQCVCYLLLADWYMFHLISARLIIYGSCLELFGVLRALMILEWSVVLYILCLKMYVMRQDYLMMAMSMSMQLLRSFITLLLRCVVLLLCYRVYSVLTNVERLQILRVVF